MKKILFVSKSMDVGGVEKSLVSLLNTLSPKKYEIDLLLLENKGEFVNQVPYWINIMTLEDYKEIKAEVNNPPIQVIKHRFGQRQYMKSLLLLISYIISKLTYNYKYYYKVVFRKVKKVDRVYDIAISYTSIINYISWFVCFRVNAKKKIGWIHFDVSELSIDKKLMLYLHENMDTINVVSKEALSSFTEMFPELKERCQLKYNVIDKKNILKMAEEKVTDIDIDGNEKIIVTLGRLTSEKGQDIIPEVALKLKETGLKFKWYIIGDGHLKDGVAHRIQQLGISDNVILLGKKINPYPYLKYADLYVQTSIHEGFCITLAEAKIFGMPIVSTKFAGAEEQLKMRDNCLVVERNVNQLSNAILNLI